VAARLRITGGMLRGRSSALDVPDGVRPTSERVREALFSIVGQDLVGVRFLDACAGSGLIAAEAWSRGAEVIAFEAEPPIARQARARLDALGAIVDLRVADALQAPLPIVDVAFVDPPYAQDPAGWLETVGGVASLLVYESDGRREAPGRAGPLTLDRVRRYGDSALWVYGLA
jgi:16S rRNA (guanine966-N2)-methyltransferase